MSSALQPVPPKIRLDILMRHNGQRWVAHCLQLNLVTSGSDPDKVFEEAQDVCAAQIIYALENNMLGELFRPPDAELLLQMFRARSAGIVEAEIRARVADESDCPLELEFQRIAA